MSGIAIYMEGGGGKEGKAALRTGMGEFLKPLRDIARARGIHWKIVACGGRDDTYKAFEHAVRSDPEMLCILLVDAECEVTADTAEHLRSRDGWDVPQALASRVHLMAQVMETWLIADAQALQRFYGRNFAFGALPRTDDLETVDKALVLRSLESATTRTQKGTYHKIRHASKLLELIDAAVVRRRCARCNDLFSAVENLP